MRAKCRFAFDESRLLSGETGCCTPKGAEKTESSFFRLPRNLVYSPIPSPKIKKTRSFFENFLPFFQMRDPKGTVTGHIQSQRSAAKNAAGTTPRHAHGSDLKIIYKNVK